MHDLSPTNVITALPVSSLPNQGVFLLFERSCAASTFQTSAGSTSTTSAEAPTFSVPSSRKAGTTEAGPVVKSSTSRRRVSSPLCTSPSPSERAVSRPTMPLAASANTTSFSESPCGAWSVAMASSVPSASAARTASRSRAERSGGFIFALVS